MAIRKSVQVTTDPLSTPLTAEYWVITEMSFRKTDGSTRVVLSLFENQTKSKPYEEVIGDGEDAMTVIQTPRELARHAFCLPGLDWTRETAYAHIRQTAMTDAEDC